MMKHAKYAGIGGGGQLAPYCGPLGDAKIAEQAVIASKVLKAWTEDNKAKLRKYKNQVTQLRRVRDEINEFVENKGHLSQDALKSLEGSFNDRAATANELMKALVQDYKEAMMKAGVSTSLGYNFYDLR